MKDVFIKLKLGMDPKRSIIKPGHAEILPETTLPKEYFNQGLFINCLAAFLHQVCADHIIIHNAKCDKKCDCAGLDYARQLETALSTINKNIGIKQKENDKRK